MGLRREAGSGGGAKLVPGDWEANGFAGLGIAYGAACGVGVNVPGLPR